MDMDILKFWGVERKPITRETILEYLECSPKRIHFATNHSNALRKTDDDAGVLAWLNLPFNDSVGPILKQLTGIGLYKKKSGNGYCYPVKDESALRDLERFIKKFNNLVFLRDNLDMSVALSMNMVEEGVHTEIGEWEYQVKYHQGTKDVSAELENLTHVLKETMDELPYYGLADYICAVPSSRPFIDHIIDSLDKWSGKNISKHLSWEHKTSDIKNEENHAHKFEALEGSGLAIDGVDLTGKTVVLVDDLYKSGMTMQYVAMKLKEAGAHRVFGICLVKSLGN